MERADLLAIDLESKMLTPEFRMNRDSSSLYISTLIRDEVITYKLGLDQVDFESLAGTDFIPGRPDGTLGGSIDFSTNRDSVRKIAAEMQIAGISYFGEDISDIYLNGSFTRGESDDYSLDLQVRMDSSSVEAKASKNEGGEQQAGAAFSHFPLITIQPFTREYLSELGGDISGRFNFSSDAGTEQFDGEVVFEDARMKVNILNSTFSIPPQRLLIADERLVFDNFTVLDTLKKALRVDGYVDLGIQKPLTADLDISSSNLQLMTRDKESRAPFSGDIFIDSKFSVKGPLTNPDIAGKIVLSEGTEIFYQHQEDLRMSDSEKIVSFVKRTSSAEQIAPAIFKESNLISSSIATLVEIDPSTKINFSLAKRMFNIDLNVTGGGQLQYNMTDNDQVTLTGRYEIGKGAALLKLVGWPDKSFTITEGGFIRWDGMVENPELKFEALNRVTSSYVNPVDNTRRDVIFNVILQASGLLSDLNVLYTIRTPDQYVMSIINTMSPDEQMRQAIQVLLFETIDLPGISSSTDYMTQQVNQILSSQLNQLTKSTIKGVDISFGLDSYDDSSQGGQSSTSLSYEVKKSLLNKRGQIEVSGRLHDVNQEPGAADHSLSNLSFEYMLDSAATKYLKFYSEQTYDDVFEGEVTKTGIGFKYKKTYKKLSDIWRRKR